MTDFIVERIIPITLEATSPLTEMYLMCNSIG